MVQRETCRARDALHAWLRENDKTQAWLARMVGVSAPSVVSWLDGSSRPITHLRDVIARLTGIAVEDWDYPSETQAREQALARIAEAT